MPTVQLRNGFSDRNNINSINKTMQITDFDERTRNRLENLVRKYFLNFDSQYESNQFQKILYDQVFCITSITTSDQFCFNEYIKPVIQFNDYDEVLTLIEFLNLNLPKSNSKFSNTIMPFYNSINNLFKEEYVGYRFVNGLITTITNETEIKEIESAISNNPFSKCSEHINKALRLLSDISNPDYSNSIKESITAVESICQIITQNDKGTLGDCLKILKSNSINVHPALNDAFNKMFGYTSDANGIRHANGIGEGDATQEEAQFMLVTCSAFINYLIANYSKIKQNP